MKPSTGILSLDEVLCGLCPGDNIVWQVNSIDDYYSLVNPFVANARAQGDKLVYFRFAQHKQLVQEGDGVEICMLKPEKGFEQFITKVHDVIRKTGRSGCYVFDSLSELVLESYSERMLGNFFMLTCPFLRELETIAYFAVIKNYHSYYAALPIEQTTQLLLDVYRREGNLYIHPLKVDGRHSPSMNMLHVWDNETLTPIPDSTTITDVVTSTPWPGLQSASYRMVGMWDRRFMQGEDILDSASASASDASPASIEQSKIATDTFNNLLRQIISRDKTILALAEKYFTLADLIHIWKRMIGSGLIGGKAVGMLLARAVLNKTDPQWLALLEAHDSFYVGSDIFYTFMVENKCWKIREKQKDPATFLDDTDKAQQQILHGKFPDYIVKRFTDMLDYFGQSPIIVRSSSLLEDAFGNAFAGKYESVFCANQGPPKQRLEEFINAVKIVYASAMSETALTYRAQKNVLDKDEQMALLVQRVSGAPYGKRFFPQVAGVGFSYNPYVWSKSIDPQAGMLRLVFGLGTRAVDRHDDDFARLVALNAPNKHPEKNKDDQLRHSQRNVDVLDLNENIFSSCKLNDITKHNPDLPLEMFACQSAGRANPDSHWMIDFETLLSETTFADTFRQMLQTLHNAYGHHVDIEFTTNFHNDGSYKINVVQCRPFHIRQAGSSEHLPEPDDGEVILKAHGSVIGTSRTMKIDRLVYVVPAIYGHLPMNDRYAIARLIGKLAHLTNPEGNDVVMLIGPGRWGASMPAMGVPITFSEINTVSVLCEIDTMHEHLRPDLSLGTHFFNDLVEADMLYVGYAGANENNILHDDFLNHAPNRIGDFSSSPCPSNAIRVIDAPENKRMLLKADLLSQEAVLYLADAD